MVNGTYPTWDELAAKYGTCRHPDCPDTNWGGHDRLHLRGPGCPGSTLQPGDRTVTYGKSNDSAGTIRLHTSLSPGEPGYEQWVRRYHPSIPTNDEENFMTIPTIATPDNIPTAQAHRTAALEAARIATNFPRGADDYNIEPMMQVARWLIDGDQPTSANLEFEAGVLQMPPQIVAMNDPQWEAWRNEVQDMIRDEMDRTRNVAAVYAEMNDGQRSAADADEVQADANEERAEELRNALELLGKILGVPVPGDSLEWRETGDES